MLLFLCAYFFIVVLVPCVISVEYMYLNSKGDDNMQKQFNTVYTRSNIFQHQFPQCDVSIMLERIWQFLYLLLLPKFYGFEKSI